MELPSALRDYHTPIDRLMTDRHWRAEHQSRMMNVFLLISAGILTTGILLAIHVYFMATNQTTIEFWINLMQSRAAIAVNNNKKESQSSSSDVVTGVAEATPRSASDGIYWLVTTTSGALGSVCCLCCGGAATCIRWVEIVWLSYKLCVGYGSVYSNPYDRGLRANISRVFLSDSNNTITAASCILGWSQRSSQIKEVNKCNICRGSSTGSGSGSGSGGISGTIARCGCCYCGSGSLKNTDMIATDADGSNSQNITVDVNHGNHSNEVSNMQFLRALLLVIVIPDVIVITYVYIYCAIKAVVGSYVKAIGIYRSDNTPQIQPLLPVSVPTTATSAKAVTQTAGKGNRGGLFMTQIGSKSPAAESSSLCMHCNCCNISLDGSYTWTTCWNNIRLGSSAVASVFSIMITRFCPSSAMGWLRKFYKQKTFDDDDDDDDGGVLSDTNLGTTITASSDDDDDVSSCSTVETATSVDGEDKCKDAGGQLREEEGIIDDSGVRVSGSTGAGAGVGVGRKDMTSLTPPPAAAEVVIEEEGKKKKDEELDDNDSHGVDEDEVSQMALHTVGNYYFIDTHGKEFLQHMKRAITTSVNQINNATRDVDDNNSNNV